MFNEIDGDFDDVAIKTFKVGLPSEHGLRKSLIGKPVTSLRNSWTELISTRGSKTTNIKEKRKLRLFLRKLGILGRTDTIITGREEIM